MTEEKVTDYEKLLKRQIISFDLHKNQSYVDRLMKEGEIRGLIKLKNFYLNIIKAKYIQKQEKMKSFKNIEDSLKKFDILKHGEKASIDLYKVYKQIDSSITNLRDELNILKATEFVFATLDKDIENSLTSLDILEQIKETKGKFSPDVKVRVDAGLCGLKRPGGKKKFSCNGKVVTGTKYCKEHLKKYDPISYTDIFEEN